MHLHEIIESVENLSDVDVRIEVNQIHVDDEECYSIGFFVGELPSSFEIAEEHDDGGVKDVTFFLTHASLDNAAELSVRFTRTFYPLGEDDFNRLRFWLVDHEFTVKAGEKFSPEREQKVSIRKVDWQLNPELMEFPAMGCGPAVKEIANDSQ